MTPQSQGIAIIVSAIVVATLLGFMLGAVYENQFKQTNHDYQILHVEDIWEKDCLWRVETNKGSFSTGPIGLVDHLEVGHDYVVDFGIKEEHLPFRIVQEIKEE